MRGFSTGGHLCAGVATLWNNEKVFSVEKIGMELYKLNACILYSAIFTARLGHCEAFLVGHVGEAP